MSGPKDFDVDLAAPLLAVLGAFRAQQQAAFDARVQALRRTPRRRRPAPRAAVDNGGKPVTAPASTESNNDAAANAAASRAAAEAESAAQAKAEAHIAAEFADICDAVESRRDALAEDAALRAACGDRFARWADRCSQIVDLPAGKDALSEARAALAEGEALVAHSLDVAQQSERRRQVQKAILESFHAIGFFTELATSENPADPAQPVTIVARKGTEEVTVSLPLGDAPVQSRWQGQTDERCVDSFFDYVEQMGHRGMKCRPARADLADRPRLRQAGRKDLPRSRSEGG